ncbi:MAG: CAP domain-containing protein, partial [Leptospirales bacterium]
MKKYTIAMICLFFMAIPLTRIKSETKPVYLSELEYQVLLEMNIARTNPGKYIEFLKERKGYFKKEGYYVLPGSNIRMLTNEGVSAVDEAIRVLSRQKSVSPLKPSYGMSRGAKDHVKDTGPRGIVGHYGSDKSSPFDRVNRYGDWQSTAGENISYRENTGRNIV